LIRGPTLRRRGGEIHIWRGLREREIREREGPAGLVKKARRENVLTRVRSEVNEERRGIVRGGGWFHRRWRRDRDGRQWSIPVENKNLGGNRRA